MERRRQHRSRWRSSAGPRLATSTAATATERGLRAGVLLGTAYLFTREATASGSITDRFQEAAIAAQDTVLLGRQTCQHPLGHCPRRRVALA